MGFASYSDDLARRADDALHAGPTIQGPAGGVIGPIHIPPPLEFDPLLPWSKLERGQDGDDELHRTYAELRRLCSILSALLSGPMRREWDRTIDHAIELHNRWSGETGASAADNSQRRDRLVYDDIKVTINQVVAIVEALEVTAGHLRAALQEVTKLRAVHPGAKLTEAEIRSERHTDKFLSAYREIGLLHYLLERVLWYPDFDPYSEEDTDPPRIWS